FSRLPPPPTSPLFPYTTLFRSLGVSGPQPPAFIGFEANNTANLSASGSPSSGVTNNFGTLNTNMATFTMWVYPTATEDDFTGLRSEEHTSELQSRFDLVCRLLL